jgi:serine/threonine protein kinase
LKKKQFFSRYTTNIELTHDDRIRLCSPTISTTKLNGGIVQHHHLWRHAPECLIRMIMKSESSSVESFDNSKEDVWSIACIIVEMMINTILFRPPNDDPSLQLLCIVQFVGGLTLSLIDRFPSHVKQLFSNIKCDSHQQRLQRLLKQIFHQYTSHSNEYNPYLYDLLKQMFQFQSDKRIELQALIEHPFYSTNSINKNRLNFLKMKTTSIQIDDLIHLCTKLNLEQSRWVLKLKERCLFELILHIKNFNQFNSEQSGLSQSLQNELKHLIYFLTGNQ